MKLVNEVIIDITDTMPPTRGHDLKLRRRNKKLAFPVMPPTRGHDLKLYLDCQTSHIRPDAPHTGARLETI